MKTLTLKNRFQTNATLLPNDFIDNYMIDANGEFVKVYLFLLRHLDDPCSSITISTIADCLNNTENNIKKPSMVIVKITGIIYIIPGIITGLILAYLAFSYFTTPESQRSLGGYSIPYVMAAVIICIFYIYIGCELILSRKPKLMKRLLAISIPMNILCIIFFLPFAMIPIFEIFLSAITTYKVDLYQKYQDKTDNLSQTSNQNINKLSNNT